MDFLAGGKSDLTIILNVTSRTPARAATTAGDGSTLGWFD